MRHVNSGAALARSFGVSPGAPARLRDRLVPSDLELDAEARRIWETVFEGVNVIALFVGTGIYRKISKLTKSEGRYCPLEALAQIVVWCANRGIAESRIRMLLSWLDNVVATVYAGNAHADLDALDLEEQELDNQEDTLSTRRHVHELTGEPVTRADLEDEAVVNLRQAAILQTRARELRRRARQLSHTSVATTSGELA